MKTRQIYFFFVIFLTFLTGGLFAQSADVTEGCFPIEVNFTAPGNANSFFWDFQDGATSFEQNPGHIFSSSDDFVVEFREVEGGPLIGTVTINVYEQPIVAAITDPDPAGGCAPLTVNFQDASTVNPNLTITSYNWVFGDASPSSSEANPAHTYQQGTFNVSLAIETNIPNCNATGQVATVEVSSSPSTSFTTNPNPATACNGPLTVTFTNTTAQPGLTYQWDFGNGETSTLMNPGPQTYEDDGLYTVSLTATDDNNCSSTVTRSVNIGNPVIDIAYPDTVCLGSSVTIQNNSAPGAYSWDFGPNGDPATSNASQPSVAFNAPGEQTVMLTVTANGGCTSDTTFTIFVDQVDATFTTDPSFSCSEPLSITFTPAFIDSTATYSWVFQDDSTSMEISPVHDYYNDDTTTYSINGRLEYITELTVTTTTGCVATFSHIDTLHQPNALFMPDTISGCAPLSVIFSDSSSSFSDIVSWEYNFGDGTVETFANDDDVTHLFNDPGEYDVILTIENANGCLDTSYAVTIEVGDSITPAFMVDLTTVCPGDTVHFTDLTQSDDIDAWHFSAEGGRTFHCFDQNELFYAFDDETGPQDVSLTVEYNGCFSTHTEEDLIQVNGPIAAIDYEIDCEMPFNVAFRDSSMDATMVTWDFGDSTMSTTSDLTHLYDTTGDYTVFLTAENSNTGCPASVDSVTIFIRDIQAGMSVDSFICIGDMVDLDASTSQDVNAGCWKGFDWHFSEGLGRPITTQDTITDKVFNTNGDHTVTLVVTDLNGCRDTTEQDVWVFEGMPDFSISDDPICLPATVDFMDLSMADTTIVEWEWDFGDMAMSTDTNPSHTYSKPADPVTSIPVTLTITDAVGCPTPITKNIQVYEPESDISADPGTEICVGTEIEFMATDFTQQGSSLTWDWDFGQGTMSTNQTETVLYDMPGTFEVVLNIEEIATGCQNTETIMVDVQAYPEAAFTTNVDGIDPLCHPVNIDFMDNTNYFGSPNNTPFWDLGAGVTGSGANVATSFDKGVFEVELFVETSFGCRDSITRTFNVVGPEGDFTMSTDVICQGESITFTIIDEIDVSSFTWDFGDGTTMDGGTTVTHQYDSIPPGGSTIATLLLRGENDVCEFSVEKTVNIHQVIADFQLDDACFDANGNTINNTSNLADIFTWDLGDGTTSTDENPTVVYDPGTYDVQLIVESSTLGCQDSITQQIEIFELPVVMVGDDFTICEGQPTEFGVLNSDDNSTYLWTPADFLVSNSGSAVETLNNLPVGNTTFAVEQTDVNGCQDTDELVVSVAAAPVVSADDAIACQGTPITLAVNDQNPNSNYSWLPDGNITGEGNLSTITANITSTTVFTVTETDEDGCTGSTNVTAEIVGTGIPTESTVDTMVCQGSTIVLPVVKTNDVVFNWTASGNGDVLDLSCTDCSNPMVVVDQDAQSYRLEIIPVDVNAGCDPIIFNFNLSLRETPEMPNAFTPDGNDENDFFNFVAVDPSDVDRVNVFRIYNRFGNVVYDNGNPTEGWDGSHKGKLAPSDVYLYRIEAVLSRGGCPFEREGEVTLIR